MKPGEAAANRGFYAGKFVWKRTVKGQRALGTGKKKKPRNSSPRPRPLFAHVTHAQIVEQKLRSH